MGRSINNPNGWSILAMSSWKQELHYLPTLMSSDFKGLLVSPGMSVVYSCYGILIAQ